MWDPGAVPDDEWKPLEGRPVPHRVVLPDSSGRDVVMRKPLLAQLAEAGYSPADITHLALSHYHWDHTANANAFAGATWLVRQSERDAMFAPTNPGAARPATYAALRNSKTTIIVDEEYDIFGDGSVVLKRAPGHTPGHQVLYVKLPETGAVVLSGDLYHFQESRSLRRIPTFEVSQEQTASSREAIEVFLTRTRAQLWIQHDQVGNARLKKSPLFYQ